jgi:hypothetical protein
MENGGLDGEFGPTAGGAARFAHPVEREIARIFDEHGIEWEYEPHTFVLERSSDGTVHEAFTPDFFLPELGMYVECTVMSPALSHRKRKKARKAQRLGVNVEVLFRRDIERLASRWRLDGLERAARTHRSSRPDRRHEGRDRLG